MLEGSPHLMHGLCLPTTRGDKGQHLIGQSMFAAWTASSLTTPPPPPLPVQNSRPPPSVPAWGRVGVSSSYCNRYGGRPRHSARTVAIGPRSSGPAASGSGSATAVETQRSSFDCAERQWEHTRKGSGKVTARVLFSPASSGLSRPAAEA